MIEVRDAIADDLPAILEIYNDVIATTTAVYRDDPATLDDRQAWWQARVTQGYPVLVAHDDGAVLGFASFGDFRAWPGYRFTVEHTVHVRSDCRGRGVGHLLMTDVLRRGRELGKHVMVAGVDAENAGSIRFHERLGFERVGHLHEVGFKFGRRLDLVFLQKMLDSQ